MTANQREILLNFLIQRIIDIRLMHLLFFIEVYLLYKKKKFFVFFLHKYLIIFLLALIFSLVFFHFFSFTPFLLQFLWTSASLSSLSSFFWRENFRLVQYQFLFLFFVFQWRKLYLSYFFFKNHMILSLRKLVFEFSTFLNKIPWFYALSLLFYCLELL